MDITNVLFTRRTGKNVPSAYPCDNLFGMRLNAMDYGEVEKTIDFTPVISISDALAKPAIDLQCKITAVQEGSGDPSPQNIRNIVGWNGLTLHVNSSEIPVIWQTEAGTVYGGVLDVTTGELTVTQVAIEYDGSDDEGWGVINLPNNVFGVTGLTDYDFANMCDSYKMIPRGSSSGLADLECRLASSRATFMVRDTNYATIVTFKAHLALSPITVVYTLLSPITYTLTPTEITLLAGANTLWSDTGDSKLTYLAKKG